MTKNRVIIYEEAGADPQADVLSVENHHGRTRVRAVAEPAQLVQLVTELTGKGVDRIELCGGFGAVWHARARQAAGGQAEVGAIYYGFESLPGVASYKERFEAGETLSEAFLIVHEGADPEVNRVVRERDTGSTTFVAVPDEASAAAVAGKMAGDLQLIELYGAPGPDSAAPVIAAVDAGVPVGVTAWAGASPAGRGRG
ncbi:DUF6506 family protein [Nonomuraea sp. NPDC050202]|jgi:hypothetical protein|uniref:DUF6506 family protein n=1 Tax=Nonomuraea sp. NPDC050202 TaxID=3155035 RepID=UPI0033F9D9C5